MWKETKYLAAYITPLTVILGLSCLGIWSFTTIIVGFGLIPTIELLLPKDNSNFDEDEEETKEKKWYFDLLLYLNLPLLYALLAWYIYTILYVNLATYEIVGLTTAIGFALGVMGINVAHELGHRQKRGEQLIAKLLLLPNLYMHFFIEHNRGHHVHIATDADPASSRLGEWVYAFYFRSIVGGYFSAARLERQRLSYLGLGFWHWRNEFLQFQLVQSIYIVVLFLFLPVAVAVLVLAAGLMGVLLLETVNYIEHYGLRRQRGENGRYERVQPHHSWNSEHALGRILLYELTRHSDHHFKAARKYQVLRHMESPQLPLGYPASMILALLPPLWFWLMNPRVAAFSPQKS
jgi:alkane 1-monooxygenase